MLLFFVDTVFGAACCGGGFASPSLISSDDKAQVTTSLSATEVTIDNVDAQGFWRSSDSHQKVKTLKLDASHIFFDRWQAGVSVPVIQRSFQDKTYSGLSDTSMQVGYEYLPEWSYSLYQPKGIGYITLVLPTGKSKIESEIGGIDSRGNGFWALGFGTLLTKSWTEWDLFSSFEIHSSLQKDSNNRTYEGQLRPGIGGNFGFGAGFNSGDFRFGSSIIWTYEDPIKLKSATTESMIQGLERFATGTISVSRIFSEEWSASVGLTDQTLFGSPINTSLARGASLQLQRRWGR